MYAYQEAFMAYSRAVNVLKESVEAVDLTLLLEDDQEMEKLRRSCGKAVDALRAHFAEHLC